jgi:hypothetical protein
MGNINALMGFDDASIAVTERGLTPCRRPAVRP